MGGQYTRGLPELVVAGSASRDVATDDPRGWRLGGGVTYGALTAAQLGVRTAAVVGVDGPAATAPELDLLRIAGVDLELVDLGRIPVFENVERPEGRVQECLEPGLPLPIDAVPAEWRVAPAWLLAPVAGELGDAWAGAPAAQAVVGLGWQGLLRDLAAGERVQRRAPTRSPLLDRADVVGASAGDLGPDESIDGLLDMLRPAAILLLTHGDRGGVAVARAAGPGDRGGRVTRRAYPAVLADRVVDPTGAGDAFLAAFLTTRLTDGQRPLGSLGAALRFAATVASFLVERPGLLGVPERSAVAGRLARPRVVTRSGDDDPG